MPKVLTDTQIDQYRTHGFVHPIRAVPREDAAAILDMRNRFEAETGKSVTHDLHFKMHLYFKELHALAQNPVILDAVEDLIGPDILLWVSNFWIKAGGDGTFVSWHQDSAYFGLDPHDTVNVWFAVTDSDHDNGCMRVIPGSHREPAKQHVEIQDDKNHLARGQTITDLDENRSVDIELKAGEFSIHNEHLVHGSLPNNSDRMRAGFAFFYMPTHVRSTLMRRSAWLVRGVDKYGHWDADPQPECDRDPKIMDHMLACFRQYTRRDIPQEATGAAE